MASQTREARADEARALFKEGDFASALKLFQECAAEDAASLEEFRVKMLGNCAQCCLNLLDKDGAANFAEACLAKEPSNPKAHYRLAAACAERDPEKAFMHVSCAAALQHSAVDPQVQALFKTLRGVLVGAGGDDVTTLFQEKASRARQLAQLLPDSLAAVRVVGTASELRQAFRTHQMIFLRPGRYVETVLNADELSFMSGCSKRWLLGLTEDGVVLGKGTGHVLSANMTKNLLRVENVLVTEGARPTQGASFCCASGSQMWLRNVGTKGTGDSAALCADENSLLRVENCRFRDIPTSQAIEVREGGNAVLLGVQITNCRQGVSCYGGAKDLLFRDVHVSTTSEEGFFFDGEKRNAATQKQDQLFADKKGIVPGSRSAVAEGISARMRELAQETGEAMQLRAVLEGCTVDVCGSFGATCDNGADVTLRGCLFKRCKKHAVFIKGGTDVGMMKCAFLDNNIGLAIGINYAGDVRVDEPLYCKNKKDFYDDMCGGQHAPGQVAMVKKMGMWSKPVVVHGARHVSKASEVPTAQELLAACDALEVEAVGAPKPLRRLTGPPLTAASFSPARMGPIDEQPNYYAIGNTPGFDLLEGAGQQKRHTRVLFGACGDVRNVVETICGWWRRQAVADDGATLALVLNDKSPSMLVRDLVLLELFRTASGHCAAEVWGCLGVKKASADTVSDILARMGTLHSSPSERGDSMPFYDGVSEGGDVARWVDEVKIVTAAWRECPLSLAEVCKTRQEHHVASPLAVAASINLSMDTVLEKLSAECESTSVAAAPKSAGKKKSVAAVGKKPVDLSEEEKRQLQKYHKDHLVASKKASALNPTMLEAPFLQPESLYYSSSIYRATGDRDPFGYIERRSEVVRAALNSGRVRVRVACCDVFGLVRASAEVEDSAYDAADFTNVADYVGPANVLAFGERLGVERLFMQQMRSAVSPGAQGAPAEAFLEQALGCGTETFARLTGMALEKSEWGGATGVLFSSWRRVAETERVDLTEADFLGVVGSYCFLGGPKVLARDGSCHHSPATLGLFRRGLWLQRFGAALRRRVHPLFRPTLELADGDAVLYKVRCQAEYFDARIEATADNNVVAVALLVDTAAFVSDPSASATLPDCSSALGDGGVKVDAGAGKAGLQLDELHVHTKALLHQIFLDFDDQWLYFVAPSGLLDKLGRASSSIVYALERKSELRPLSQLAPLSGAQQV